MTPAGERFEAFDAGIGADDGLHEQAQLSSTDRAAELAEQLGALAQFVNHRRFEGSRPVSLPGHRRAPPGDLGLLVHSEPTVRLAAVAHREPDPQRGFK